MSLLPVPKGDLRWGYSTGACATACTRAALIALITQEEVGAIEIKLPYDLPGTGIELAGQEPGAARPVLFRIHACSFSPGAARCATNKDGGDDPDVTHGAEIAVTVRFNTEGEVLFLPGEGVGMVTLPGLAIPVGQPAINPVPRRMMKEAVMEIMEQYGMKKGISISVSVAGGEAIAAKTLNGRLGIVGGISILGTTGLVKPFSAAAYIASIEQGIDVALANGSPDIVINSGGRSEKLLQARAPGRPAWAFIQYGNWIGETLAKIRSSAVSSFTIGMMLGKAVKLAAGNLNTHSNEAAWDKGFVAGLAAAAGYGGGVGDGQDSDIPAAIGGLNRAGRLTEIFPFRAGEPFYAALAARCRAVIRREVGDRPFTFVLIDAADELLVFKDDEI
jgi:cobalt-precorrin-5B (C1)-methyltransferase